MLERVRFEREMSLLGSSRSKEAATPASSSGAAPPLLAREQTPAGDTLYVRIDLGIGKAAATHGKTYAVPPVTGVYLPQVFERSGRVDVIVYLHGYTADFPGNGRSVKELWSENVPTPVARVSAAPFALRSGLNATRKNLVLVVPTLGPKAQAGRLLQVGGFDAFMNAVLFAIGQYVGPSVASPDLGRLVLACHSGGGQPMLRLALSAAVAARHVVECWGFDCLYSGRNKTTGAKYYTQPQSWLSWAEHDRNRKLFVFFHGTTAAESNYLAKQAARRKLSNVTVTPSTAVTRNGLDKHFWVPLSHWTDLITHLP